MTYLPNDWNNVKKTADVSAFVNVEIKIYYDLHHIPLLLKAKKKSYLKLYHGYEFPNRFNKKHFNNAVQFFAFFF